MKYLEEYLGKEIPEDEFVFRRVSINTFIQPEPEHKLIMVKGFFRNEDGDGMSVDWERICNDPKITQTRDGHEEEDYGVVVISCFDLKRLRERILKVISDQEYNECHCSVKGFPMSLADLKRHKRDIFDKLSENAQKKIKKGLTLIREFLIDNNAFWVIPFNNSKLRDPPVGFNYSDKFTVKIREFFLSRGHEIPS